MMRSLAWLLLPVVLASAPVGGSAAAARLPLRVPVDGDTLAATVTTPAALPPAALVLILPGSARTGQEFYGGIADHFAAQGLAAITFDRRGEGSSSGAWDETQSVSRIAEDARRVLHAVLARPDLGSLPVVLWGISQGGWSATAVAAREPQARLAILLSDPALPTDEQNLNERAWQLRERGFAEDEIADITAVRRVLWQYYASGVRPADFSRTWSEVLSRPWFARIGWPTWEPTPDSLGTTQRASYRQRYDPGPDVRGTQAAVLRLYGLDDHHLSVPASMSAARRACAGVSPDTAFIAYRNRGHLLQSTSERAECATCPEHGHALSGRLELDEPVWQDIAQWLAARLPAASLKR